MGGRKKKGKATGAGNNPRSQVRRLLASSSYKKRGENGRRRKLKAPGRGAGWFLTESDCHNLIG